MQIGEKTKVNFSLLIYRNSEEGCKTPRSNSGCREWGLTAAWVTGAALYGVVSRSTPERTAEDGTGGMVRAENRGAQVRRAPGERRDSGQPDGSGRVGVALPRAPVETLELLPHPPVGPNPALRRPQGSVHLHGPCDPTTGSAEACSLLTPPPLTNLSLPTMWFGISLCEAQAA